ncbi:MAG: HAD-IIA family hydrolase [Candidatus Enterosoma sp.]|nr:HAD-IIA family hydrolase [bacterium]MDY2571387.1 HAD-IIA family hydrolase [Candidatus Enterosoma sp.]MDD7618035.1 HAD-IIA family hydrolase [bacterium]MDY2895841.1 HAD-IIA family hydrolase [Candidatus Enterosoma sp.]MDY4188211.1 HAD-IIA family hydrolase [Candidatus Enterosoma sp.]
MKLDLNFKDISHLKEKKLFLLDMDGTLYLGENLFEGTIPFLHSILSHGGRYLFLTNNSSKNVSDYVGKMKRLGVDFVTENDFYTSAQAALSLMKEKFQDELIYVQGTRSFVQGLKEGGLHVTEEYDLHAKAILVGFDTELTMKKLETTAKMLTFLPNVPYYATNPDWVCPTEWGYVPDCGSMCFGLEKATLRAPIYIGKPEKTMIETCLLKYGIDKKDAVLFGDRPYTDIKSGNRAGIDTVLVLSGETKESDLPSLAKEERPTYLLSSIAEVF